MACYRSSEIIMISRVCVVSGDGSAEVRLRCGQSAVLLDGKVVCAEPMPGPGSAAFFRADARGLWVAASLGKLSVNGRSAPGGAALVERETQSSVRIGTVSLVVSWQWEKPAYQEICRSRGRCAISGEPIRPGDIVAVCSACSTTVIERFLVGDGGCGRCPRCGRAMSGGYKQ